MDIKGTSLRTNANGVMLQNEEYYKYIFKKTEKIVCAVFFILRNENDVMQTDGVISDLESASKALLATAVATLGVSEIKGEPRVRKLQIQLIALESQLRVAHAARCMDTAFLEVFLREIGSLQRMLRAYVEPSMINPLEVTEPEQITERRAVNRTSVLPRTPKENGSVSVSQRSRRERIVDVLKEKGFATIKDITALVTDCSEKTVQRELIALIKDNKVHREGERRWAKYNLI